MWSMIRLPELKVLKEDLIELVIVILARVDQRVVQVRIQQGDHPGKPDHLGPGPHDGHHFQLAGEL